MAHEIGGHSTLLWERLANTRASGGTTATVTAPNGHTHSTTRRNGNGTNGRAVSTVFVRMPGDTRCIARCKSGSRCRGRIRKGSDYCLFHDPAMTPERRRAMAAKAAQSSRKRAALPKGYPRRLNTPEAVCRALDRLYREIRTGVVDAAMGRTLLAILLHLADRQRGQNGTAERSARRIQAIANALAAATPSASASTPPANETQQN